MAPRKAAVKVRTWKPGTRADANFSIKALITNQKRPKVIKVRGKVRILSRTPTVALMKPITSAAIRAATGPLTEIPGTIFATIQTANALRTQFNSSRIFAPCAGRDSRLVELYQELALGEGKFGSGAIR